MQKRLVQVALAALLLAVFARPSSAQVFTGRIEVSVVDSTGAALPGATVEITGVQSATAVSDARGEAHFLNLAPGKYTVTTKLSKFTDYKNENVMVGSGLTVDIKASMAVGGVSSAVDVTASSTPLIDTRKETVSTNISLDELQKIPSSRDPWVVLQTVPGVIVDRVNVGGAESGQQSNFLGKGASGTDNTWNIDGIAITDMGALGSSPTYYDFDMFQEMQVTTGGADVSSVTPGVSLNLVLRSGTNVWRGSGRSYYENSSWQADNVPASTRGQIASYNRMQSYSDYGAEAGGALVKDQLFVWGAYGKTHPKLNIYTRCNSTPTPSGCANTAATSYGISATDATILENYSFKATDEVTKNLRASFTYFRGNKQKFGRGASASHPDETTWNQTGPTSVYKGEADLTLANTTFVAARYAHTTSNFSLTPRGGNAIAYVDDAGVWHGNYLAYSTDRPQDTLQVDISTFKGKHELKYGVGYRRTPVTSTTSWPGGYYSADVGYPNMLAVVVRDFHSGGTARYTSAYFADTISLNRFTLNLGVRYDHQAGSTIQDSEPASSFAPAALPALVAPAVNNAVVWTSLTPRLGFTYALDKDRKTILRASYSRFASQLAASGTAPASATVTSGAQYSYAVYNAVDRNGDHVAQANELVGAPFVVAPGANKAGSYKTPMTDEVIFGFDRQIGRDFAFGGNYTYRYMSHFDWYHPTGIDGSDYVQIDTYNCNAVETALVGACSIPLYGATDAAIAASNNTFTFESRPDYHQTYKGVDLYATKRLSKNWQARVGWSGSSHREFFTSTAGEFNPTPAVPSSSASGINPLLTPNVNGGSVVVPTGGSGKSNIYLVLPKYQFIFNAAYTMKYDINLGVNYLMRQGYVAPYFHSNVIADGITGGVQRVLLVTNANDVHLPNVHSLDARINKEFKMKNTTVNFDVDIFNLFNLGTTLGRQYDLRLSTANQVLEVMNPRIVRFGVRIGF